ncbi:MAG: hypothetical protein R3F42_11045 [Pseudomonadota bacterium]
MPNDSVTAYKLLLYPHAPDSAPVATATLAAALQAIGFIAGAVAVPDGVFYPAGERFLQLLVFLGCSPAIELEPPADPAALAAARASGAFCHVYLTAATTLQFRADRRAPAPRCPACRQPEADWRALVERWRHDPAASAWTCRSCRHRGRLSDLHFRKTAAFSRTWVEVRGIHPAEAVPTGDLLACLQDCGGGHWQYGYLQE